MFTHSVLEVLTITPVKGHFSDCCWACMMSLLWFELWGRIADMMCSWKIVSIEWRVSGGQKRDENCFENDKLFVSVQSAWRVHIWIMYDNVFIYTFFPQYLCLFFSGPSSIVHFKCPHFFSSSSAAVPLKHTLSENLICFIRKWNNSACGQKQNRELSPFLIL